MRHILIPLSFLLLSSPLIGQETGVLYQYETTSVFVWKSIGSKKLQPKYEGEIKRMYVRLKFRGEKLGDLMIEEVI